MSKWIKVEFNTPDKPEIRAAARVCQATLGDTFLAFFRLWTYFDQHTATGFVHGLALEDLDDLSGLKGFGRALEEVGWISSDSEGVSITNWERHNGQSAKKRSLNQRRMQKARADKRWE